MVRNADGSVIIDTGLDSSGVDLGAKEVEKRINSLLSAVDRLGAKFEKAAAGYASNAGEILSREFTNNTEGIGEKLKALGEVKIPTDEYKRVCKEIEKTDAQMAKLTARKEKMQAIGVPEDSKQWESLYYDISRLEDRYASLAAKKAEMEASGSAFINGSETEEYQRLSAELERVQNAMEVTPGQRFSGVMRALGEAVRVTALHALNLGQRLARIGFNALANGAKKAVSSLKSFMSQTRKADLSSLSLVKSLTSLKRLLITRVKRMFISAIFNNVREGIQELARFSSAFNAQMSRMKNSATRLSGNIAVAIGNIVSALEPIITRIVNLLSQAVEWFNQFFAVLSGKRTYTTAKQGAESYADAATSAAKAQKKWNNELYSFDELNRQGKNDDAGTATGAGISYGEQAINLPSSVTDWIERLKKAWKSGDWYSVGKTVADGLNSAMRVVDDWINNKFRPIGETWARRIATIFNGLVDGINWPLIGKTVADGFNALFGIVNNFLTTFNFLNLGKGIGAAIKSWFDSIEWENVGATFANGWNALLHTIEGVVTTPGFWLSIGAGIGRAVKSWFTAIDANSLANILIGVFNGIASMLRAFLDQKPFEGVPAKLANAVNRVFHEVDWATLGKTLSDFFLETLKKIRETVDLIDWPAVGRAIGDFLGSIDWVGIFTEVARILFTAFKGMLEGLFSTEGGRVTVAWLLAFKGMKSILTKGLTDATTHGVGLFGKMAAAFKTAALAVVDAALIAYDAITIYDAAKGYHEAGVAYQNEVDTALRCLRQVYAQKGPEVAAEWAKTVYQIDITGMSLEQAQEAITNRVGELWGDAPKNWKEGLSQGWNTYFGKNGKGLLGLVNDGFSGLVNGVANLLQIGSPSKVFEGLGKNTIAGYQQGVSSVWGTMQSNFLKSWAGIQTSLGKIKWDVLGHNMVVGLQNGYGGAWGTLVQNVSNMANNLVSRIKSAFGIHSPSKVFAEIGGMLDAGLENGLKDGERDVLQTASNIAEAVTNGMMPDSPEVDVTAEGIVGGMQAVIAGLGGIAETFKVILDSITAMGGLLTPEIAAGAIVPPRVRLDTSAPSTGDSDATDGLLTSVLYELQSHSRLLQMIETAIQSGGGNAQVQINGRTLFEIVADENHREKRRTGVNRLAAGFRG